MLGMVEGNVGCSRRACETFLWGKLSGEKHFTAGKVLWLLETESTARSSVFRLTLIKVCFVLYP